MNFIEAIVNPFDSSGAIVFICTGISSIIKDGNYICLIASDETFGKAQLENEEAKEDFLHFLLVSGFYLLTFFLSNNFYLSLLLLLLSLKNISSPTKNEKFFYSFKSIQEI